MKTFTMIAMLALCLPAYGQYETIQIRPAVPATSSQVVTVVPRAGGTIRTPVYNTQRRATDAMWEGGLRQHLRTAYNIPQHWLDGWTDRQCINYYNDAVTGGHRYGTAQAVQPRQYFQPGVQQPAQTGRLDMAQHGFAGPPPTVTTQPVTRPGVLNDGQTVYRLAQRQPQPNRPNGQIQNFQTVRGTPRPFVQPDVNGDRSGLLHQKSLMQAHRGRMGHVLRGQYIPGARYEGVGMSSISAQDSLRRCCYYGQKRLLGYSTVRGRRGWYSTAQFSD